MEVDDPHDSDEPVLKSSKSPPNSGREVAAEPDGEVASVAAAGASVTTTTAN